MNKVRLQIKGLSYSQTQTGAYALVLGEEDGERRLPIIIGGSEAQSIAIALEKEVNPPRPLTHDLFKNFADAFNIQLKEVVIHKLQDGVFYSILICESNGVEHVLDARTSDAVALAIRFQTPIFTYMEILDKAGIIMNDPKENLKKKKENYSDPLDQETEEENQKEKKAENKIDYSKKDIKELNALMSLAVADENYELAATIRDELDRRTS